MTSCLQKLYLGIVTRLTEQMSLPVLDAHCGFRAGHQTAEVSETARLLLKKSTAWGLPFYCLKADVSRAFDNIRHDVLESVLQRDLVPNKLVLCIMREFSLTDMRVQFQDTTAVADILLSLGGNQGGSDPPELWNRLDDSASRRPAVSCRNANFGIMLLL